MDLKLEQVEMVPSSRMRNEIKDYIDRAVDAGERFGIMRNGKAVAALVPIADLAVLERFDEKAVASYQAKGQRNSRLDEAMDDVCALSPDKWGDLVTLEPFAGLKLAAAKHGQDVAIMCANIDRLTDYMTGIVTTRVSEANAASGAKDLSMFSDILSRCFREGFDPYVAPNPPKEVMQVMRFDGKPPLRDVEV